MIVLDTNVVSEPIRPKGNPAVLAWLDRQAAETLFLTSTSLAELMTGIALLPEGRRKDWLNSTLGDLLAKLFGRRILPFDQQAAMAYAGLFSRARLAGRAISVADCQIAAIAQTQGFTVATRDTAPFVATGVPVINPWDGV